MPTPAVAAAKAFDIDDGLCLGLPHYPGDLLRPHGPGTHASATERSKANTLRLVTPPQSVGDRVRKLLFGTRPTG
jgi:hypothetical protein